MTDNIYAGEENLKKFRVIRLALLAVMNLLRKRYGMIAVFIITLALPNHNYAKHI